MLLVADAPTDGATHLMAQLRLTAKKLAPPDTYTVLLSSEMAGVVSTAVPVPSTTLQTTAPVAAASWYSVPAASVTIHTAERSGATAGEPWICPLSDTDAQIGAIVEGLMR